ncbi:MAG: hypothetical protein HN488_08225 [Saprospiraceae bacterium]|jgi:hypothetical protein|nr:hypothetical protein [Saprospiraceae bacterium]
MKETDKKIEQANHDEGKLIKVEIADTSGHQTLMLSPQETEKYVSSHSEMWIFVDNEFTHADLLPDIDWNIAESVRILPGLVGGITTFQSLPIKNNSSKSLGL